MPLLRKLGYASATSWLLVLSTRIERPGAVERYCVISVRLRSGDDEEARNSEHFEMSIGR